jgi:hypothetical protein
MSTSIAASSKATSKVGEFKLLLFFILYSLFFTLMLFYLFLFLNSETR